MAKSQPHNLGDSLFCNKIFSFQKQIMQHKLLYFLTLLLSQVMPPTALNLNEETFNNKKFQNHLGMSILSFH